MDNEFKFGFWNYLPVGTIDKNIVREWKEIGCNLFMSFRFLKGKSDKNKMIELLDEAQKVGVKVIINDERTEYLRLKEMSKEEFIANVKEAVDDFGSHPATYGFYGGDEPFSDQEGNFAFTMSLLKNLMPNKTHFGNLLPYWSGLLGEQDENNREDSFYYKKINRMIWEGKLEILAFDQYTQCYDETRDQEDGLRRFFLGMHHFLTLAKWNNIPLYVSLLSIGHYCYRDPSEIDIRWQINVAAAMGAKGVIWFYFHQNALDYGFFNPPFLGEKAYKTPMFGKIQRQQYIFNERYKTVFDNIEIDHYYFKEGDYGLPKYTPDKKFVERLDVFHKDYTTIVSWGHYRDDKKHKVMIVLNANQYHSNAFSLYRMNGDATHFDLCAGDMRIFDFFEE